MIYLRAKNQVESYDITVHGLAETKSDFLIKVVYDSLERIDSIIHVFNIADVYKDFAICEEDLYSLYKAYYRNDDVALSFLTLAYTE